jgi:hypothetical protein
LLKELGAGSLIDLDNVFEGYNGFVALKDNQVARNIRVQSSRVHEFIIPHGHFYITACKKISNRFGDFYVIFTPQQNSFIVVDSSTFSLATTYHVSLQDTWWEDDVLQITDSVPEVFAQLQRVRELIKTGRPRFEAYNSVFFKDNPKKADEFWARVFSQTDQGKAVYAGFRSGTFAQSLDEYVAYNKNSSELFILEIIALTYLNGNPIF